MAVSTQTPVVPRLVSSSRQAAFTLIELLVVILIIGILIAIAVPTFLNQQQKVQNSAAQQTLAVAYKDAKANMATNGGTFSDYQTLASQIASAEPEYTVGTAIFSSDQAVTAGPYGKLWVLLGSTGSNGTLASTNGQNLYLADVSKSGTVCTLTVTNDGPPVYGNCGGSSSGSAGTAATTTSNTPAVSGSGPTISGTAVSGNTLTAAPGSWTNSPTFTYQWQDCSGSNCSNITKANGSNATGTSYTVTSNDVGDTIAVVVTATNSSGSQTATTQTSAVTSGSSSSALALADGATGLWKLNDASGATTAANSVSGGAAASQGGSPSAVFGAAGPFANTPGSATFASGASLTVPSSSATNPTGSYTIEAWIKLTANNVQQSIIEKYDSTGSSACSSETQTNADYGPVFRLVGGYLQGGLGNTYCYAAAQTGTNNGFVNIATTVTVNTWHYVAETFNASTNQLCVFLDGGSGAAHTNCVTMGFTDTSTNLPLVISGFGNAPTGGGLSNGQIADAAIYVGTALPAQTIQYHSQTTAP